ncbi:hypothetical protein [Azospirillum agricola]|uniref:hypothetical protein n=1 Tax=Azospirillum agricola TaxID=1720247 RepID=UPI000A0F122C|nr:hypothetical protein [Azospirillum agricola]SMH62869.1 hypothetical protein SAMN02982994_6692 [Azospirillum lipoferum]
MTALRPGALVEIDIATAEGRRTVIRRISTWQDRGGDRYACLLADPDGGGLSSATLAQHAGRWLCVSLLVAIQPPPSDPRRGRP